MAKHGLIDLHTHGIGSTDTRGASAGRLIRLAAEHGRAGTSAFLPSIYPGTVKEMRAQLDAVAEAMNAPPAKGAARILGAHLEGPFINPAFAGALDRKLFMRPTLANLKALTSGMEGVVRMITIAPELPGALRVMERAASLGIRVCMGHSDATARQAASGAAAGATGVTHLFNAMRPMHHREPGLAGYALTDDALYVELIADGVHVSDEFLRLAFRAKPADRIILVSDSVAGPMRRGGVLQGAKLSLKQSTTRLIAMGIKRRPVMMAAIENPARFLGL